MFRKPVHNRRMFRATFATAIVSLATLTGGCAVDLKQVAYQAIRQGDCRLNEPDNACQANYTSEYKEYARLREDFLRDANQAGQVN